MAEKLLFSGPRLHLGALVLAGGGLLPLAGCDSPLETPSRPLTSEERQVCVQEGIDSANAILNGRGGYKGTGGIKYNLSRGNVTEQNYFDALNAQGRAACEQNTRQRENPASLTAGERAACRDESLTVAETTLSNRISREGPGFLQSFIPKGGTPTDQDIYLAYQQQAQAACVADTRERKVREAAPPPVPEAPPRSVQDVPQAESDVPTLPRSEARGILKHETFGGADFEVLAKLIMLESGGGKNTSNPLNPEVEGIYQFSEGTARRFGLKDRADPFESLVAAGKLEVHNRKSLAQAIGRDPSKFEVAFAHQQGSAGVAALINNPEENAIDVLAPIYKSKAIARQAIVNNSGDASMTSEDFIAVHLDKYNMVDANKGLAAINEILASKDLEIIDATFANPFGTKLDKTPYGSFLEAILGKPKPIEKSEVAGFVRRIIEANTNSQDYQSR